MIENPTSFSGSNNSTIQVVGAICTSKKSKPPVETAVVELQELSDYLKTNVDLPEKTIKFKRGTVCNDGRLDLCKQNVGPQGAEFLCGALKSNTKIKHLLMGDDSLGVEGAKQVANIIKHTKNLETVYLGCNYFEEEGSGYLSEALEENENVKGLWIKRNHIGLGGAKRISQLMSKNNHIQTLDLITNDLGPDSIEQLKIGLLSNSNSSLKALQLDSNPIGVEGSKHLGEIIMGLKTLEMLSIENTSITDKGCDIICQALSNENHPSSLKTIDLRSNDLKHPSAISISKMIKVNKSLKEIDLGHSFNTIVVGSLPNQIGDSGIVAIATSLKYNKSLLSINLTQNNNSSECASILIHELKNHNLQCYVSIDLKSVTSSQKVILLRLKQQRSHKINEKIEFVKKFISPIISVYRVEKKEKLNLTKELININDDFNEKENYQYKDNQKHSDSIINTDQQHLSFTFNSLVNK